MVGLLPVARDGRLPRRFLVSYRPLAPLIFTCPTTGVAGSRARLPPKKEKAYAPGPRDYHRRYEPTRSGIYFAVLLFCHLVVSFLTSVAIGMALELGQLLLNHVCCKCCPCHDDDAITDAPAGQRADVVVAQPAA